MRGISYAHLGQVGPTDIQRFPWYKSKYHVSITRSRTLSRCFRQRSCLHRHRIERDSVMDKESPRIPASGQSSGEMDKFGDVVVSFADTVFGFWDDVQDSSENLSKFGDSLEDENDENSCSVEAKRAFWEEQDQLLQATLCRTSSIETKIRQATKEGLRELNLSGTQYCICRRPEEAKACRNCLQREICNQLLTLGYNCSICKSKWRSSSEIASGEHTYLEVMDKSSSKRGEVKVVIELNFRAEFEMARANEEYNRLVSCLPEVYVGKAERLRVLIKILCSAAKKCMKEMKMHLGPWRKQKYMQAKWLGTCVRLAPAPLPTGYSIRPPKPRASMLTCDLLENLPGMHSTVVEVV